MNLLNRSDAILYLFPPIIIVIGMTLTLTYSFWRYHRKKMISRRMQHDYMEAQLDVKRPRIGALRCNTHISKWIDMAQSLSASDFKRMSRYYVNQNMTQKSSARGNGYNLDTVNEVNDKHCEPFIDIGYNFDNESVFSSSEEEGYKRNSYYEDRGLPSVPRNILYQDQNKPIKKEKTKFSLSSNGYNLLPSPPKSGKVKTHLELINRKTTFKQSPRKLGNVEDGYWQRESFRYHKSRKPFQYQRKEARSLSHEYEYDLNLPGLKDFIQEQRSKHSDIHREFGKVEQYKCNQDSYRHPAERKTTQNSIYTISDGRTMADNMYSLSDGRTMANDFCNSYDNKTVPDMYNLCDSRLVWVNLDDVPQSSV